MIHCSFIYAEPHTLFQLSAQSLQNSEPSKATSHLHSPNHFTPQPFLRNQVNPNLRRFQWPSLRARSSPTTLPPQRLRLHFHPLLLFQARVSTPVHPNLRQTEAKRCRTRWLRLPQGVESVCPVIVLGNRHCCVQRCHCAWGGVQLASSQLRVRYVLQMWWCLECKASFRWNAWKRCFFVEFHDVGLRV